MAQSTDPFTEEVIEAQPFATAPAAGVASLGTPKQKTRGALDHKKVIVILVVLGGFVVWAIIYGLTPTAKPSATSVTPAKHAQAVTAAPPSSRITALAATYSQAAQQAAVPQLGPKMPNDVGGVMHAADVSAAAQADAGQGTPPLAGGGQAPLTPQEQQAVTQIQQRARLDRLKRAAAARSAGLSFASLLGAGNAQAAEPRSAGYPPPATQPTPTVIGGFPGHARKSGPNEQTAKAAFLKSAATPVNPYLEQPLIHPANNDVVQAGTIIPALFLTGINSDLPGMLIAQVSQPVYDSPTGRTILIPQGTRLIGAYDSRVTYGQSRVLLVWTRMIFPDGASIALQGMPGVDMGGYAGVHDLVDNHWGEIIGAIFLSSVLSTASVESQGNVSALNTSPSQLAAQGAAQGVNQAGSKIVQRQLSIQPTLIIRPGQQVDVMVDKDIQLPPYSH